MDTNININININIFDVIKQYIKIYNINNINEYLLSRLGTCRY